MKNKYIVDLESAYLCPDNNQLEIPVRKYRVDRLNRTHRALSVDFSLARPLDNTVEAVVLMEKESDGGWINLPVFPYQRDPCRKVMDSSLDQAKLLFIKFARALGAQHPEKCDIPAGKYSVDRYPLDLTSTVPFWTGRFRSTLVVRNVKDKKKILCLGSLVNFKELSD
ncbi:hypothetical protein Zmor_018809 [Zophobas morio]|uniref:Uncharacterized protein n=1 Tax=Zophobas morio TaxID=2755281 RepID=A0AA38ME62_9CUCU|nr:hypothetical protein Zmor_018809 [Zophobas morio]